MEVIILVLRIIWKEGYGNMKLVLIKVLTLIKEGRSC